MPLPDTLLRKLFNWAVSCGIIAAPVGVYERLIYERLISIGSRGHLKISDKPFMEKRDWINRLGWGGWESIAESLPQSDLENLARGLIITERELEWPGGSVAASIKVFRVYEKKFGESSIELANWALKNRGRNQYTPFGRVSSAKDYDGWLHEQRARNERLAESLERERSLQEEAKRRKIQRIDDHKERLREGKSRATLAREFNDHLSAIPAIERLKLVAHSEMPLEVVAKGFIDDFVSAIPLLDDETASVLLKKIGRRNQRPWAQIRQALES